MCDAQAVLVCDGGALKRGRVRCQVVEPLWAFGGDDALDNARRKMSGGGVSRPGHGGKGTVARQDVLVVGVEDARGQGSFGCVVDEPEFAVGPALLDAVQADKRFEDGGERDVAAEIAGE